jgi:hypothetical protein
MAYLHYGSAVRISVDETALKRAVEAIGAHASRGGWVTVPDTTGRDWTFLVTVGIPIWITPDE